MSLVQEFLRNGGTIEQLAEKYAIKTHRHAKHPNLVHFKYNQLESPMEFPLVRECRALILDESNGWEIAANCMPRFFNYGEGSAAEIDWSTAKVQEKVDGSLIQAFWYKGEWLVCTSGTADASGAVNGFGFDFSELFWKTHEKLYGCREVLSGHKDHTYIFELMTPFNRVIVPHKESHLSLITVRRNTDGFEFMDFFHATYPRPKTFPMNSWDNIMASVSDIDPMEQEGYVVIDSANRRVKVKSPQYCALAHLRDGFGPRRVLEIVRLNESSEFLAYFKEWEKPFFEMKERFDNLVAQLEDSYALIKDIVDQKAFALEAQKSLFSGALYLKRSKGVSMREYLAKINIKHLMEALKVKDIEF